MKLNLGCGTDIKPGYTNVDFRATHPSVLQVDLSTFPWPFEDGSADEILMLDFLEHFPYGSTPFILLECFRILTADGTVVIQVPDGDHLARAFAGIGEFTCNRCENNMPLPTATDYDDVCKNCGQTAAEIAEAAMRRMYGGQDYVGNYHQTLFTMNSLLKKAKDCGLELVGYEEERHQFLNWNFKARFKKADLW
jgi:SAM-dependent methyltransferase